MKIRANSQKGYYNFQIGGVLDIGYLGSKTRRGRVEAEGQICPTITATNNLARIEDGDNRKFLPQRD